jgi:hypothetical protein
MQVRRGIELRGKVDITVLAVNPNYLHKMTDTRRRVKLYALNAERQWDDRGTGHVSSSYIDRLKGISLLVRAESDGSLLLESKIHPDTAYQKQQVCTQYSNSIRFTPLCSILTA